MKSILAPLKKAYSRRGIDGKAFHQRFPGFDNEVRGEKDKPDCSDYF